MCTVKFRHKDKLATCRFFVVTGDGQALLWMPDIKLLVILNIMCDVVEGQQANRKSDSQTMESASSPSCKVHTCQIISGPIQREKNTKGKAN